MGFTAEEKAQNLVDAIVAINTLTSERDEARGQASHALAGMHRWKAQAEANTARTDAMRANLAEIIAGLPRCNHSGDETDDYTDCTAVATWHDYDTRRCDKHKNGSCCEYAYAPALRRAMGGAR